MIMEVNESCANSSSNYWNRRDIDDVILWMKKKVMYLKNPKMAMKFDLLDICAKCSLVSYGLDDARVSQLIEKYKVRCDEAILFGQKDAVIQGVIFKNVKLDAAEGNHTLISFRGSDTNFYNLKGSIRDWATNFKVLMKKEPSGKGRIHLGFYSSYEREINHNPKTSHLFHTLLGNSENLIITGHSLGGALAILCAKDLSRKKINCKITCVSFGAPRVGNSAFVKSAIEISGKIYRVINGNDIVPSIPLPMIGRRGFRHCGEKVKIGKRRVAGISIRDHFIKNYVQSMGSQFAKL